MPEMLKKSADSASARHVPLLPRDCSFSFATGPDFVMHGALGHTYNHWLFSRLLEEVFPAAWSMEVARVLLLYRRRPGNQSQYSSALAAQVNAGRFAPLVRWLEANLGKNLTVERLAEVANMTSISIP